MSILFKLLIVFGLLYLGYRAITKPFRDFVKAARKQSEMNNKSQSQANKKRKTKTEDLGEYIDYEEVDDKK